MKESFVRISVRLTIPAVSEYYNDTFRTRNFGAERAAEIYPIFRVEGLNSLKGIFTFDELELLSKIMESAADRFELSKEIFIQKINRVIGILTSLKPGEKGMVPGIIQKIEKLNFYEAVILSEWLCSYHSFSETYKGKKNQKKNFKDYAQKLI
jgi:hypothetical protein